MKVKICELNETVSLDELLKAHRERTGCMNNAKVFIQAGSKVGRNVRVIWRNLSLQEKFASYHSSHNAMWEEEVDYILCPYCEEDLTSLFLFLSSQGSSRVAGVSYED